LTTPNEQQPETRDLRRILRVRIRAAENAALHSNGDVSADELEAIDRLKRLVDISSTARLDRSARAIAAAVVVLGVIVCAVLLETPVRHAPITLDASASYVGFRPTSGITILSPLLPGTTVNAPSIDSVTIGGRIGADTTLAERSLQLAARPPASMSVAAIDVAPFEPVRIGARRNELQISVGDSAGVTKLELNGSIDFPGSARRPMLTRSGFARLWHGPRAGELFVRVADTISGPLTPVARIDSLQLYRVARSGSDTYDSSMIIEGKLDITSVDAASTRLGPDEAIQFSGLEGDLKAIRLQSGSLVVSFSGTVRRIVATNGRSSRSLMPSMFSYLASRHTAEVVWTTLGWVIVTAVSLLRWWHRPASGG
jgi:hypothetical protein